MQARGFLLHPTYRILRGGAAGGEARAGSEPLAVVHLYGRLLSGETFLIREGLARPRFYVRASDADTAAALGAGPLCETGRVTLRGEPVVQIEVALPSDVPPLRSRLERAGVPTFEADVRFALRGLIDRGIRGGVHIAGPERPGRCAPAEGVDLIFDDPLLTPDDEGHGGSAAQAPPLRVLSLDLETDPRGARLLSAALSGCGADEVLLVVPPGRACPPGALPCADERQLLATLARRVRQLDPDILTGWNVIDFDLQVLARAAARLGQPLELGRARGALRVTQRGPSTAASASLPGRVVLDGIQLLRGAFIPMEEYSLDHVSRAVLGDGKLLSGAHRAEEILALYEDDPAALCAYNLKDAQLVLAILDRLRLIDLSVARSRLTGMPLDRVAASVASVDFLYLAALHRRGVVAPSHDADAHGEATAGGHVLEPLPGLYRGVVSFDFKSLYPSLIRTFQIDPLGHARAEGDVVRAPSGAAFARAPGVLTEILDELFQRREAAKAAFDSVRSHAIKILMNSVYGVLGTPACRFYSAELANAITSFGKEVLLWTKARFEQDGRRVLYGDTDSLFVELGPRDDDDGDLQPLAQALVRTVNQDLAAHLRAAYGVQSRLELELDRVYLRLLLPHLRGSATGARKRYAGLSVEDGREELVLVGLEAVRRDWTQLARTVQRSLYERLFHARESRGGAAVDNQPVAAYLQHVVEELRAGRSDALLVYRKALRKPLHQYTASTPPHVAAARRAQAAAGQDQGSSQEPAREPTGFGRRAGLISYVMTQAGPEPAEGPHAPIDYEHYVEKQLRPVAEPVLALLGLSFDALVQGGRPGRQLSLF